MLLLLLLRTFAGFRMLLQVFNCCYWMDLLFFVCTLSYRGSISIGCFLPAYRGSIPEALSTIQSFTMMVQFRPRIEEGLQSIVKPTFTKVVGSILNCTLTMV